MAGCVTLHRQPVTPTAPNVTALRPSALVRLNPEDIPLFEDDLDTASLRAAALQSLSYYRSLPQSQLFVLGIDSYTAHDLADSMAAFAALLESLPAPRGWDTAIRQGYAVYQSAGTDPEKTVVFSSYYEPTIAARPAKDPVYQFPFYARPPDLVDVDLGLFDPAYQGARLAGRRAGRALVPYATREDIDSEGALRGKNLEIAWAKDPMEVLDLQIEGSGWLDFGQGRRERIRYDGDNGRRYRSVGQYMIATGRIPAKIFSRAAFLRYMASHPGERQSYLNINERYIFFRIDTSTAAPYAYGNINVPLTPGRSIATDPKCFPKGALAWISTDGVSRFVVNQDEGGAIQGPGRVDLFAGHGQDAARFAAHLWNKGKLYFLVKKKS